ncbi:MAG: hypothetical protein JXB50_10560 [Spirochaetes bacterium]|nr:hypothetical protein [Spirochaetota bacterium]
MAKKIFILILYLNYFILLYPQTKKEKILVPQRVIFIKNQIKNRYIKYINEEIFRNCEILDSEKSIRFIKDFNTDSININEIKKEEAQKIYLNSNIRGIIYTTINETGNNIEINLNFFKTFNNEINTEKIDMAKNDFFIKSNELSNKIIFSIKNNFLPVSPYVIKKEKTESYKILRDAPERQLILGGTTGFNGLPIQTAYSFIYNDYDSEHNSTLDFHKGIYLGFNLKSKIKSFYIGGKANFTFFIDERAFLFDSLIPIWDLGAYFVGDLLRISNFTYIEFSHVFKGLYPMNLLWGITLLCFEVFPVRQVGFSISFGAGTYIILNNPYNDDFTDSDITIVINQTSTFYIYKNLYLDIEIDFKLIAMTEQGPVLNNKFLIGFGWRLEKK